MLKLLFVVAICYGNATPTQTDYNKISERAIVLLKDLIQTETTNKNEEKAVAVIKKRLDSAHVPYEITEFEKGRKNIVARLKGNGSKRPMLILAHSDVVPTKGQNWDTPPHVLTEKPDGYLYGRGTLDDLGYAAIATELLIEMKNNKTPLNRDVILAITGDEERGGNGIKDLIARYRDSIDAEFALNEGGAAMTDENGKVTMVVVSAAEKTYQDFRISAQGSPGHSSVPVSNNAIYRLSDALSKLGKHHEPIQILPVTENYFNGKVGIETDPKIKAALLAVAKNPKNPPKKALKTLEAIPVLNALMRTTCVATVVQSGAFDMRNVLPASAEAIVNCRILPGTSIDAVKKKLATIFNDPKIEIENLTYMGSSEASVLDSPVMKAAAQVSKLLFNNAPIVPNLMTGATDSRFLRETGIPSYGIAPLLISDEDRMRAHAANERIRKDSIPKGAEYFHRLILELAASPQ